MNFRMIFVWTDDEAYFIDMGAMMKFTEIIEGRVCQEGWNDNLRSVKPPVKYFYKGNLELLTGTYPN